MADVNTKRKPNKSIYYLALSLTLRGFAIRKEVTIDCTDVDGGITHYRIFLYGYRLRLI